MIRAFIAVELPRTLQYEVAAFQTEFKKSGADVKWVEPANLHLTLKFLGEIEENRLAPIQEALGNAVGHRPHFTIHLEGIGAFPRTTSPRVIWVGVHEGGQELVALVQAVEQAASGVGFPPEERPFEPHLTIGRVRSPGGLAGLIKKLQVAEFRATSSAPVTRLTLFQSLLSPKGPTYSPLAEVPLGS